MKVTSLHEAACIMRDTHAPEFKDMLEAVGVTLESAVLTLTQLEAKNVGAVNIAAVGAAIGYLYAMRSMDAAFKVDDQNNS